MLVFGTGFLRHPLCCDLCADISQAVEPHLQRMFHNLSDTNKDDKFDTFV